MSRHAHRQAQADAAPQNNPPQADAPRFAPVADQTSPPDGEGNAASQGGQAIGQAGMNNPHMTDPDAGHLYVMDRSATVNSGPREHVLVHAGGVQKPYTFTYDRPTRLPFEIAVRFLKSEGFIRTDKDGTEIPFRRVPKRPEELQAGEKLTIADDEVIARYDELTNEALKLRAAMLPESEEVIRRGPREAVIQFIVAHNAKMKALNSVNERVADEFTPPPVADDEY